MRRQMRSERKGEISSKEKKKYSRRKAKVT